jgi:hypothetical protein
MTTIAQSGSGLEVAAPSDAMDLHSDSGFDFPDGEIDFEYETTATDHHQGDDDLSLHDAVPDAGLDLQTTFPDQDDFMADKDDLIEEDDIEYGDVEVVDVDVDVDLDVDAGQPSRNSPAVTQEITIDDDLIDYSDEEDEQPQVTQENIPHVHAVPEQPESPVASTDLQGPEHAQSETLVQTADEPQEFKYKEEEIEYGQEADRTADQTWDDAPDQEWEQNPNDEHIVDTVSDGKEHAHQHEHELHADDEEEHEMLHLDESAEKAMNLQSVQITDVENDAEVDHVLRSHQVTVNYDGSEYWLFKPEDSESEDEWLLPKSDQKYAKDNLLFLFGACRTALGGEIGGETEMGFRFDNLHSMELFEESTACMQTSLGELVNIYLKLHAQDGSTSPESFYITLRFRPRVSALLGELRKAVQDETGYSGLNTAVAAGQTAFATPHSNKYTDDEHEHEEEEQKSEHDDEHAQQEEYQEEDEDFVNPENEQHEHHSENNSPTHLADEAESVSNEAKDATVNKIAEEAQDSQEGNASPAKNVQTPATTFSVEGEGDIIDYSDDEEEPTDNAQPDLDTVRNPSSGSSTVKGDDETFVNIDAQAPTNPTEFNEDGEQPVYDHDEGVDNTQNGEKPNTGLDADFGNYEETTGTDPSAYDNHAFNEEFNRGYDQDAADQGFEVGEYAAQDANDGDAGYYYEEAGTNQQDDLDFLGTVQDDTSFGAPDQVVEDDVFADLDDTFDFTAGDAATGGDTSAVEEDIHDPVEEGTNDVIEDDYINYDDNEGGTVEQLTVATSAAAQPVAASSTGLDHKGSPQGQKRSIDEVGNGLDFGTDLSGPFDTSSPFLSCMQKYHTDLFYPDAKRPRV